MLGKFDGTRLTAFISTMPRDFLVEVNVPERVAGDKARKVPARCATNSRVTRVLPVFGWLEKHGGQNWAERIVALAHGITTPIEVGAVKRVTCEHEKKVGPSAKRIAWMVRNPHLLAASDGKRWREYERRVVRNPYREEFLKLLGQNDTPSIPRRTKPMILEGKTSADCLIETEHAIVWIEGKRNDWLSPGTSWDITRDQLARNLEAAKLLADEKDKDYCVIICHEFELKHHEQLLVCGYRSRTWIGGWPHLDPTVRDEFSRRIGTLTWSEVANAWPELTQLEPLRDIHRTKK